MATVAILLPSSYTTSAPIFFQNNSITSSTFHRPLAKTGISSLKSQQNDHQILSLVKNRNKPKLKKVEKIQEIHCIEEYDTELQLSQEKLVIAHFSATHYKYNSKTQQFMGEQCRLLNEVNFIHVMADESEKTRELCRRENINRIPHFVFYTKMEKIHEESGFQLEKLVRNILYYRDDPLSPVVQLRSGRDLVRLINSHKLIVLYVGKRQCVPCVRNYASVLKLAGQMNGRVVFARMNGDENDDCVEMLRELDVKKVPAFLFMRNGAVCGRYVGSCMSSLIGEVMKFVADHRENDFPEQNALLTSF